MKAIILLNWCIKFHYYFGIRPFELKIWGQNNPVYKELAEHGRMTTEQIEIVYEVPCVEVMLESGESIRTFVYSIPSLKKNPIMAQEKIALINGMHYLLVVNGAGNISTDKNKIFAPCPSTFQVTEPKILPHIFV